MKVAVRIRICVLALASLAAGSGIVADGATAKRHGPVVHVDAPNADRCDPLGGGRCAFPFPNDYFTKRDRSTPTGKRVNLNRQSLPANLNGVRIDATEFNRADGFSPNQQIVLKVPGLDTNAAFDRTGLVPLNDLAQSFARRQPVVLINTRTHRRQLIWADLDAGATSPASTALVIHPAKNLDEGTRYVVALRNLKTASGATIPAPPVFRAYRDGLRTDSAAVELRRPAMRSIFKTLRKAHIPRHDLYLAWDFTVASKRNSTGRMLRIRNDAFAQLGDTDLDDLDVDGASPQFTVTSVQTPTVAEDAEIERIVTGTVRVPCYLQAQGCPAGSAFNLGPDGLPVQKPGNVIDAPFRCVIPRGLAAGEGRALIYGHGLLGDPLDSGSSAQGQLKTLAVQKKFVVCGTYWIGLSDLPAEPGGRKDIDQAIASSQDFSNFPPLVDRLQQGVLDYLYLGRAMVHPDGLRTNPGFQLGGKSLIRDFGDGRPSLFYDGNSEGGIEGGLLMAVAPDLNRGVLGVPGVNYPVLIQRSVDFDPFRQLVNAFYPDALDRSLIYSLLSNIWDRGEPNGYLAHLTDWPLRNTPAHKVLFHVALGDHQVAPITVDIAARTIGARVHVPAVDPGRSTDVRPFFGIRPITPLPVLRLRGVRIRLRAAHRGQPAGNASAADREPGPTSRSGPARVPPPDPGVAGHEGPIPAAGRGGLDGPVSGVAVLLERLSGSLRRAAPRGALSRTGRLRRRGREASFRRS